MTHGYNMKISKKGKSSKKNLLISLILFMISILFFLYGIVIFSVHSGTYMYFVWFFLGLIFLLLGLITFFDKWKTVPKALKAILAVCFTLFGLLIVVTWSLMIPHFFDRGEKNADAVIVLGAQVKTTGPSTILKYRLDIAIDYLNENPSAVCIVSGYRGKTEPFSEAKGMKDYLVKQGISEERVIMEDKSKNSSKNLEYSKKLLPSEDASVVLVTNNTHMYRALAIARKKGYKNISGLSAETPRLFLLNNMLYESMSIVKNTVLRNM